MKKLTFKNLVSLARREPPPAIDVTNGVLSALTALDLDNADPYRAYTWFGAASAAVAACILVAVTLFWQSGSDSVNEMMTYVSWIAQ
jgi:hypothetical protein